MADGTPPNPPVRCTVAVTVACACTCNLQPTRNLQPSTCNRHRLLETEVGTVLTRVEGAVGLRVCAMCDGVYEAEWTLRFANDPNLPESAAWAELELELGAWLGRTTHTQTQDPGGVRVRAGLEVEVKRNAKCGVRGVIAIAAAVAVYRGVASSSPYSALVACGLW